MENLLGYKFQPSNEQILYLLVEKRLNPHFSHHPIKDIVDICSLEPWDLATESKTESEDQVWYFFCEPYYKYRKSNRAHRRTKTGHWKITSRVSQIEARNGLSGIKKILTFYRHGLASKEAITEWVMHEYHVTDDPRYKENLMHATIRKTLVTRFKHMLSEGSLYNVKNLKVVSTTGEYRPLSNQYKIIFLVITSLKRLEEGTVKIPINGFQFVSPNLINLRVNDNTILSDVIGSLCGVGDIEIVGAGWKKRDIKILTDYSVTTKITLWGKLGEMFDPNLYKKDEGPCIVIVTSTTIKKFQGEVNFSTTSASKIYINLQIDYVASLIERFSTVSNVVQVIESSNVNKITFEEEMFLNRMSIEELLEAD